MAILTKPTIAKGQANEIDLSKSDLAAVSKVVSDSYFSDQANWSKVVMEYESAEGNQHEMVIFDASEASPKGNFEVSEKAKDNWQVKSVIIMDFDGGYLKLGRGDLTVENFDIALGSVGGDVGAIYTAFNYVNVLRPDGLGSGDYFGQSVAISGDYIVVGSYGDDGANDSESNSGAAYVFKINGDGTISLLDTLRPLDINNSFGESVAISGDYIVVGFQLYDGAGNSKYNSGAAYVFKINANDTISLLEILKPDELDISDNFGRSVAISGDYIVVGAYNDDGADNSKYNPGAAYVFKINGDTITLLETLRPDSLDNNDYFGISVAISGDYIVVGAYGDDGADNSKYNPGAAYVFKINGDTVTLLETLRPDELDTSDFFGQSIAIDGDYIVVGAWQDDGAGNSKSNSGAAYVFKINANDTISLLDTLRHDELDAYDYFGESVAISGDYIVVGSYGDGGAGNSKSSSGAAYVFKINGDTISLLDTLRHDELDNSDYFGEYVAISGDYIVVGAYGDDGADDSKSSSGAAYLFKGVE